ncbi:nitrous oxide reductase accessory protein NosL [Sinimarinibacterium sp. CAU 1509]|nr:nitrous oxide reductase accessory protein NosL [Sinimarinibacterium sp. CAU 1509]
MGQSALLMVAAFAAGALIAACREAPGTPVRPLEVTAGTACSLDGMLLADYPGPKAQIHYASGTPDFFCDTVEMFSIYLQPEQQKRVAAIYVQDMGATDWDTPAGHWIDARSATYVHGSRKRGSMGPTLASFARESDARSFATQQGGHVMRFEQVTPDMVALDGGALHDSRM